MASNAEAVPRRPSKYVHEMNSEERLESLKQWAEEKKYVRPGDGGTIQINGPAGINALAFGGHLATAHSGSTGRAAVDRYAGQYYAPVGPPAYGTATQEPVTEKKNALKRWYEKRKEKRHAKRNAVAPPYVP